MLYITFVNSYIYICELGDDDASIRQAIGLIRMILSKINKRNLTIFSTEWPRTCIVVPGFGLPLLCYAKIYTGDEDELDRYIKIIDKYRRKI